MRERLWRMARRAGQAWPLLVYAAAVVVLLGPSLVGQRVALPHDLLLEQLPWSPAADVGDPANPELRDAIDFYYPIQRELIGALRGGELPVWLRDVHHGAPGVHFVGWGMWSPFKLLPALVLPFDLAWSWAQGLVLLAAMAGAHLLAREFRLQPAAATVAGLSYGLSGFVVGWLPWPQSDVAALLPFVLWAARRAITRGRWYGPLVLAPLTALLWLAGFPAVAVYGLLAAGVVALHAAVTYRDRAPPVRRLLGAGGAVVAGTALAAVVLLPSLAYLGELHLRFRAEAWSARILPPGLITFVVPGFFGNLVDQTWWFPVARVETVAYAGVVTLLLALPAWLLAPRRAGLWLWSGLVVGFVLLSYGFRPLQLIVRAVPVLSQNAPSRTVAIAGLGLAMLGGFGADAVARRIAGTARAARRALLAFAIITVGVLAVLTAVDPLTGLVELARERLAPDRTAAALLFALRETLLAVGLVLLAVAGVAAAGLGSRRRPRVGQRLVGTCLVAVVAVDMLLFGAGWNVQVPRESLFPDGPGVDELAAVSAEGYRVAGSARVGLPNTHLVYDWADLRSHVFLTTRQYEVLGALGARFFSPTRWGLEAFSSADWEPWLSAAGVAAVLTADQVEALPATYPQADDDAPLPVDPRGSLRATVTVEQDGDLIALLVRVATYQGTARGDLQVEVRDPAGTRTSGSVPVADLADNAIATVPVRPIMVAAGTRLQVTITSTTSSPGAAPAVYGLPPSRPLIGPVVARDEAWEYDDLGPVRLFRNPAAPPRVYAVAQGIDVTGQGALEPLSEADPAQLGEMAYVEIPPRASPWLPEGGAAAVVSWDADEGVVRATVDSSDGAVLVALEAALAGWSATVDGEPADVVIVNHTFLGVPVPAGEHDVVLRYAPPGLRAGVVISLLSALALGAWAVFAGRRAGGRSPRSATPRAQDPP